MRTFAATCRCATWSDGKLSVLEMARRQGARPAVHAITDHSQPRRYGRPRALLEQVRIRAANEALGPDFRVLHATEMEIRADGTLDFPDEVPPSLISSPPACIRASARAASR